MAVSSFLKPRLIGDRFEGGAIPLDILADLAVLTEMIVEIAKWKYLLDHPGRKRSPRGFAAGVTLRLTSIQAGSAVACMELVTPSDMLFPPPSFLEARSAVIGAIGAAQQGSQAIKKHLPAHLLGYFDRLGRRLGDGEAMEFQEGSDPPARLTKESRRELLRASLVESVTEEIVVYGLIPAMDQQARTIQLQLLDGSRVQVPIAPQHCETVLEATYHYSTGMRVRIHASGQFNRARVLQGINEVEHVEIMDPLDIGMRVEELKLLKHGWLDGQGVTPNPGGLTWMARQLETYFSGDLPLPYLYPTVRGGLRAEWPIANHDLSLDVNLSQRIGEWHALNLADDSEVAMTLDLKEATNWELLAAKVRSLQEIRA